MKKIEKWNKTKISEKFYQALVPENIVKDSTDHSEPLKENPRSVFDLFRYPNLRKRTFILMFCMYISQ